MLILRISYGLVNIRLAISVQLLVLGMIKALTSTDATEERKRERGSGYAQRERERDGMILTFVPPDLEFDLL